MPSRLATILLQVVSLLLFALVSALVPEYFWVFFILYFIVIIIVTMKMTSVKFKPAGEARGSPVFKEENAYLAMTSDTMFLQEMKSQVKAMTLLLFLPLVVIFIVPPLYYQFIEPYVEKIARQISENAVFQRFLINLCFYSTIILVLQAPRLALMKSMKQTKQILAPRTFAVYKSGIVLDGRYLQFTEDMCYRVDSRRKFAEIRSPKLPYNMRLYTVEISKLEEKLREVKLGECKE